jgi:hypothetical protein
MEIQPARRTPGGARPFEWVDNVDPPARQGYHPAGDANHVLPVSFLYYGGIRRPVQHLLRMRGFFQQRLSFHFGGRGCDACLPSASLASAASAGAQRTGEPSCVPALHAGDDKPVRKRRGCRLGGGLGFGCACFGDCAFGSDSGLAACDCGGSSTTAGVADPSELALRARIVNPAFISADCPDLHGV